MEKKILFFLFVCLFVCLLSSCAIVSKGSNFHFDNNTNSLELGRGK